MSMELSRFKVDASSQELPNQIFTWLSDATILAKRPNTPPETVAAIYSELTSVLDALAANPKGQSRALRLAFGALVHAIAIKADGLKIINDLVTRLLEYVDAKKQSKYNPMKHFAVVGLGHIATIPVDGLRLLCCNVFLTLADALKVCPSASNGNAGYRRGLLWSLQQVAVTCDGTQEPTAAKNVWKLARSLTADPAAVVAAAAFSLMQVLASPEYVRTTSKFAKITSVFTKALDSPYSAVRSAAAAFYAHLISQLEAREIETDETASVAAAGTQGAPPSKIKVKVSLKIIVTTQCAVYCQPATSTRTAIGIVDMVGHLLALRSLDDVRTHLAEIIPLVASLATDLPASAGTYRTQLAAEHVRYLLVDVIGKQVLCNEQARLEACTKLIQTLATADKTRARQSVALVPCLTGYIDILDSAIIPLADNIQQMCIALLENNPEWPLQVAVIQCLDKIIVPAPQLILPLYTFALQKVSTSPSQGYAYLISLLSAKWETFPTYVSLELTSQMMSTATNYIKAAQRGHPIDDHIKFEVGWILLEGVLCLGARVVKLHISQLLLLWKSCLSRPAAISEHDAEIVYQLKTRQRALTGLAVFIARNGSLITGDVARRLGAMLHTVWSFVDEIPQRRLANSPPLGHEELLIRRRLLQCYGTLADYERSDVYPASLLTKAVFYLAEPTFALAAARESSAKDQSLPDSVFDYADNCAGGLTSLALPAPTSLEDYATLPVLAGAFHDADELLLGGSGLPLVTQLTNASIIVTAKVLVVQTTRVQESMLDKLRALLEDSVAPASSQTKTVNPRTGAIPVNISVLIHELVSYGQNQQAENYQSPRTVSIISDIIQLLLGYNDSAVRQRAAVSYGLLSKLLDSSDGIIGQLKYLIDTLVADLDPIRRSGCACALGAIMELAPSRVSSPYLDTVLGVLTPLSNDPHPYVHTAAIEALRKTLQTAGLGAVSHASSSLDNLTGLYLLETHGMDTPTTAYSNIDLEQPTVLAIAQGVSMLVSLLGPDLDSSKRLLSGVYRLIDQFQIPIQDPRVTAEAWVCFQELFYFAKAHIDWITVIQRWRAALTGTDPLLRTSAIDSLLILFKPAPEKVFAITGSSLQSQLWLALDETPDNEGLRQIFWSWLDHTAAHEPAKWIQRLQNVIMRPRYFFMVGAGITSRAGTASAPSKNEDAAADLDEEGQSLGGSAEQSDTELLGWRTRQFASELLLKLVVLELRGKPLAKRQASVVTKHVGDVIKIAFSAATSTVLSTQVGGLALLEELVNDLADLVDPDFPEVHLLEQYQAQVSSALTPAFASGSSPELAMCALKVCGTFIGSGIIKQVSKMGRILRVMTDALASASQPDFSLGDLSLSPNAQGILKVGVLRLWASLVVSSLEKEYLVDVVAPHQDELVALWIASIKDYAKLRFEPEQSSSTSFAASLDQMHAAQLRQVMMSTYQESWLDLVAALASLIEDKGMDVLRTSGEDAGDDFVSVLFGLCFEALLRPNEDRLAVLLALQRILLPSVALSVIADAEIFTETVDVLSRIVLTGNPDERACVIVIARNLATGMAESDESVDHLFELFRLCTMPLRVLFPSLADLEGAPPSVIDEPEYLELVKLALDALVDMVQVFREVIQNDLFVCLLYVFEKITELPETQAQVVPHIFGSYKRLMEVMAKAAAASAESAAHVTTAICTAFVDAQTHLLNAKDNVTRTNRILTCMVIYCTSSTLLAGASGNVAQYGEYLARVLKAPELAKVAGESIRACLTVIPGTPAGDAFLYGCLPTLVRQATDASQPMLPKLVTDLLVQFSVQRPEVALQLALAVLLHVAANDEWLSLAEREAYARARLVTLVNKHPQAFKQAVQEAGSDERERLQKLLVQPAEEIEEPVESEISLKSFV